MIQYVQYGWLASYWLCLSLWYIADCMYYKPWKIGGRWATLWVHASLRGEKKAGRGRK